MATHELRVVLGYYDAVGKRWLGLLQTRRLLTWTRPPNYGHELVTVIIDHARKEVIVPPRPPPVSHIILAESGHEV